jgi:periplasmic copper chaperone A
MRSFESVRRKVEASRLLWAAAWLGLCSGTLAAGGITVTGAWVAEAPPGVQVMAGYLKIVNDGAATAVLVGATSPDFERVELHRTVIRNGVARMLHESRLPIPAHAAVVFEPGGRHLMLIGPRRALKAGDRVPLTLQFADGAVLHSTAEVRSPLAASAGEHHHEGSP